MHISSLFLNFMVFDSQKNKKTFHTSYKIYKKYAKSLDKKSIYLYNNIGYVCMDSRQLLQIHMNMKYNPVLFKVDHYGRKHK